MKIIFWLLHPDPRSRASLRDLQKDKWVNQPVDISQYSFELVMGECVHCLSHYFLRWMSFEQRNGKSMEGRGRGRRKREGRRPYTSMAATHCVVVSNVDIRGVKYFHLSKSLFNLMLIPNDIKPRFECRLLETCTVRT